MCSRVSPLGPKTLRHDHRFLNHFSQLEDSFQILNLQGLKIHNKELVCSSAVKISFGLQDSSSNAMENKSLMNYLYALYCSLLLDVIL